MSTVWELGEDVRDEDRLRQDELWADAVADGRAHVSHRELTMMYGPQFCSSIDEYKLVEMLVNSVYAVKSKEKSTNFLQYLDAETLRLVIEFAFPGLGPLVPSFVQKRNLKACIERLFSKTGKENSSFMICLRKRPLCHFEENQGLYDVCRTDTANTVTLHEGKLARNGRQLSMTHRQYVLDHVFSSKATNNDVCSVCVEPLLSWVLTPMAGHRATLLCFGQTGTGKTYTLYGALDYMACRLVGKNIRLTFYEVHGKKCYDLLNNRTVVHLRSDENEDMHVRGAVVEEATPLNSAAQLMSLLRGALMLRSSRVTERNPISSRSHAVCSIEIDVSANRVSAFDSNKVYSRITLVDLAGSERNYETVQFKGADHKESAEINMALMALKNCFRAFSLLLQQQSQVEAGRKDSDSAYSDPVKGNSEQCSLLASSKKSAEGTGSKPMSLGDYLNGKSVQHEPSSASFESKDQSVSSSHRSARLASAGQGGAVRIPYRETLLTRVLKDCFTISSGSTQHRTTIVATVSPTSTDLVHSVNTLDHVVKMSPQFQSLLQTVTVEVPMTNGAPYCHVPISQWTPFQVTAWLATTERGRFAQLVLPPNLDGKGLLNLSENVLNALISQQLSRAARREAEGSSWVYVDDYQADPTLPSYNIVRNKYDRIGKALWNAIRRQQMSALALTDAMKRSEQQGRKEY